MNPNCSLRRLWPCLFVAFGVPTDLLNGQTPEPTNPEALQETVEFNYDATQNLLSRTTTTEGIVTREDTLPLDGSGRNRPASVNGVPLEWDANGNLARKGDRRFLYDYRNRLTRVTDLAGETIASYAYDPFNRRIEKTVTGETRQTVWNGWQPTEEYQGGQLISRRTYGPGLDEIIQLETDLDGDGVLEEKYVPLYDDAGNLVVMTGRNGKPIERYEYTPYGEQTIFVDSMAPAVEQVRSHGSELWLEISEPVASEALAKAVADHALTLVDVETQQALEYRATQLFMNNRLSGRRLAIIPFTSPAVGAQLRLTVPPEALRDFFLNQPSQAFELAFVWPAGDAVLFDETAPKIDRVAVREGALEIRLTEEPSLATAEAIQVDGSSVVWTLGDYGYLLKATSPLAAGPHTLTIGAGLQDLGGHALGETYTASFALADQDNRALFDASDPRRTPVSTIGNAFGFQGLPQDSETGFVYVRNRYYDPQMGRFITADPLGYVDGPNLYQYGLNSPLQNKDPLGLAIQLTGDHPGKDLEILKSALSNPAAANMLVMVTDSKGRKWVRFTKGRAAFEAAGIPDPGSYLSDLKAQGIPAPTDRRTLEQKVAAIIASPRVVEYRTGASVTKKTSFPFSLFPWWDTVDLSVAVSGGGAVTLEPSESLTGNTVVVVDPKALDKGSAWTAERAYHLLYRDPGIALLHELGHALATIDDNFRFFQVWSVETENQIRARRGSHIFRTSERPLNPDPKTLRPLPE